MEAQEILHHLLAAVLREAMNSIRKHFLASPAFSYKQNRKVGGRDFADDALQVPDGAARCPQPSSCLPRSYLYTLCQLS